ncbi:fatty acid hydroxylase domain-containing protein 2-like [Neocloeon triangulifer]|uniref:fatty acid hydroxylase domain-containing protein 2-like n=1 Tax=Neocloeon triangulifer TaxID=2078957 RepID=UPI00286ECB32|nr:fatty acid hydroxylase domain-containing protein 2-like [Neocloeon triangulifer]
MGASSEGIIHKIGQIVVLVATVYLQLFVFTLPLLGIFSLAKQLAPAPDYWQLRWDSMVSWVDSNQRIVFGVLPSLISGVAYWSLGSFFLMLDFTGWLSEYKVQLGTNQPPSPAKLGKAIRTVLFNQIFVGLFTGLAAYEFVRLAVGVPITLDQLRELPSIPDILRKLAAFIMIREIIFYYNHRIFHHRWFYKRFHKQHHEWTAPIAVMTLDCHPLEHLLCNLLPTVVGPSLYRSHPLINYVWFFLITLRPVFTHSGYHLPFAPSSESHDFHHMVFNQNYGNIGIMDAIHGTDAQWRKTASFQMNFTYFNLMPARQLIKSSQENKLKVKLAI